MNIAGQISNEWRQLTPEDKGKWEELAREDKERYQREKAAYVGPWKVRANLRRPKDPNSPKKPIPAYFAFSNERRQEVKNNNPTAANGDISRILSKMWKESPEDIRKKYQDNEAEDRAAYNEKMKEWKAGSKEREAKRAVQEAEEAARKAQIDLTTVSAQAEPPKAKKSKARASKARSSSAAAPKAVSNPGNEESIDSRVRGMSTSTPTPAAGLFPGQTGLFQQPQAQSFYGSATAYSSDPSYLTQLLGTGQPGMRAPSLPQNQDNDVLQQLLVMSNLQNSRGISQNMMGSNVSGGMNGFGQLLDGLTQGNNGLGSSFMQMSDAANMQQSIANNNRSQGEMSSINALAGFQQFGSGLGSQMPGGYMGDAPQGGFQQGNTQSAGMSNPNTGGNNAMLYSHFLGQPSLAGDPRFNSSAMGSGNSTSANPQQQDALVQSLLRQLGQGGAPTSSV